MSFRRKVAFASVGKTFFGQKSSNRFQCVQRRGKKTLVPEKKEAARDSLVTMLKKIFKRPFEAPTAIQSEAAAPRI